MSTRLIIRDDGDVIVIDAYGKLATGQERNSLHAQLRRLAEGGRCRVLLNLSADIVSIITNPRLLHPK